MIYVSIDIETTGLDRDNDQVLEFGAIIEDANNPLPFEELPKYSAILQPDRISGSAYALNMNKRIIEILAQIPKNNEQGYLDKHNILQPEYLGNSFANFLYNHFFPDDSYEHYYDRIPLEIVVAGKNFDSFDKQFLLNIPNFSSWIKFHHRSINVAEYFIDFKIDTEPPSLTTCLKRAGFEDDVVSHTAIEDAWQVIKLLRTKY